MRTSFIYMKKGFFGLGINGMEEGLARNLASLLNSSRVYQANRNDFGARLYPFFNQGFIKDIFGFASAFATVRA